MANPEQEILEGLAEIVAEETGLPTDAVALEKSFTDDLDMRAIADHFAAPDVARACLLAGVDAFLCCQSLEGAHRMIDAITDAVRSGAVPESRLAEAVARMDRLLERWAKPPIERFDFTVLGSDAHREIVERIGG